MTQIYGHRGARGEAPENTLASFRKCLASGVRRCELDLHLSSDEELMVIHDPTLRRTTGKAGKVAQQTAAQLTRLDARHSGPAWPEPCPIPTLKSLFEHCRFEHWQLEVKSASRERSRRLVRAIRDLVLEHRLEKQVTLTSSSREVLRAARQHAPELSRGLVAEHGWLDPIKVALGLGCEYLVIKWTLCTPARVARARQQGLHVSVWTVNDPSLMHRLVAMDVDSIITDFPSLARQHLHP